MLYQRKIKKNEVVLNCPCCKKDFVKKKKNQYTFCPMCRKDTTSRSRYYHQKAREELKEDFSDLSCLKVVYSGKLGFGISFEYTKHSHYHTYDKFFENNNTSELIEELEQLKKKLTKDIKIIKNVIERKK